MTNKIKYYELPKGGFNILVGHMDKKLTKSKKENEAMRDNTILEVKKRQTFSYSRV